MALTTSARNPADVVNLALVRIGYKSDIGSLYEGSPAAQLAIDTYGQVRDELLRKIDPGFAQQTVVLTLLKQAPATGYFPPIVWSQASYPPPSWLYEYAYPDECIKLKVVKQVPLFGLNFSPRPNPFDIADDPTISVPGTAPSTKVVLSNVASAVAVITARITDVTIMDAGFVEAFASMLGERLAPALVGLDAAKAEAAEGQMAVAGAAMEQG